MGFFAILGKIILFPFKLIFGRGKRHKETESSIQSQTNYPQLQTTYQQQYTQPPIDSENLRAKVDLMLSQIDSLKIEYEALNQRIQNIERMIREIYAMAKS